MTTATTGSSRLPTTVPALAAVLVSAMLLSVAVATGTAPRLTSGVAMQAMLFGSTGSHGHDATSAIVVSPLPETPRPTAIPGHAAAIVDHDTFLVTAPSMPGRGALPPPAVG